MGLRPRDGGGARRKIGRLTVDVPPLLLLLFLSAAAAAASAAADEVAAAAPSAAAEDEEAYPQDGVSFAKVQTGKVREGFNFEEEREGEGFVGATVHCCKMIYQIPVQVCLLSSHEFRALISRPKFKI